MAVPRGLLYSKEHVWVKREANLATLGITFYAQYSLGQIVFVDLPSVGTELKQSCEAAVIESSKAVSSLYSPLSGKVIKVNDSLVKNPELANKSPYGQGWFLSLEVEDEGQLAGLMDNQAYDQYLEGLSKDKK